MARHRLADLFLDTLPYNAHTTASDALWAGLPVLTKAGRQFAARVGASLVHAAGLPDLVTECAEDYETLALELAPHGIRVNQLIPGRIRTDRVEEIDVENAKRAGIPVEEQRKRICATIPLGGYGDPDDFAAAAVFLFSNSASYITGASLQVDGGLIRGI